MRKHIVVLLFVSVLSATPSACGPAQTPVPTLTPTATKEPIPTVSVPEDSDFHVNPIEGLSPDFIMGADVSMLKQIEDNGGKFYVDGEAADALEILKAHGVNWIRLRIWNDPTDENGEPLGGGNNDLETTVAIAARAKAMGFKFLLDFHYSDWWADPGKQNMPKAWEGLDSEALNQALYDYTAEVIKTLAGEDAMPDMVQIGNEVNSGMMWPAGKTWSEGAEVVGGYDGFADLLKQSVQAVRDNDPNAADPEKRVKIIIHLADGGNNSLYRTMFDELTARDVPFDIIGLSYYSYWHGPMEDFINNMADISARYDKNLVVLEAAYAFTLEDADGHANLFPSEEFGGYKASIQGQATAVRDVIAAVAHVPNGRGLGIFYWEPEWIAVEGAGWATAEGNAWENQALFDFEGSALPSLNVFNMVKTDQVDGFIPATVTEVYPIAVAFAFDEEIVLPTTVKAVYSDDSIRDADVMWAEISAEWLEEAGVYELTGTIEGSDLQATASITTGGDKNYLVNAGFESGSFSPWVVDGDAGAVDISNERQNLHEGKYAVHYWADEAFALSVTQTVTGLENGTYVLSAWIQGGGGEDVLQLFADCGGETQTVDVPTNGWLNWYTPTIENIQVTDGTCTVGMNVVASGGQWAFLDETSLYLVE